MPRSNVASFRPLGCRPLRMARVMSGVAAHRRDLGAPTHALWDPRAMGEPPAPPHLARACQALLDAAPAAAQVENARGADPAWTPRLLGGRAPRLAGHQEHLRPGPRGGRERPSPAPPPPEGPGHVVWPPWVARAHEVAFSRHPGPTRCAATVFLALEVDT